MVHTVIRKEDMSVEGQLRVTVADDGDVHVSILGKTGTSKVVEFCSTGAGGGGSPRTLKALRDLFVAMALDNEDQACSARQGPVGVGVSEPIPHELLRVQARSGQQTADDNTQALLANRLDLRAALRQAHDALLEWQTPSLNATRAMAQAKGVINNQPFQT